MGRCMFMGRRGGGEELGEEVVPAHRGVVLREQAEIVRCAQGAVNANRGPRGRRVRGRHG